MEDDKKVTKVYFVTYADSQPREHKLIKAVTFETVIDMRLKMFGQLSLNINLPVLDDDGLVLDSHEKLPDRVRILVDDKTFTRMESEHQFV
jgi:hypothetical protein